MLTPRKTLLILAALAILTSVAMAQSGNGRHKRFLDRDGDMDRGPRHEMRLERMTAHLELSEAQVTAIEAIHEQAAADGRDLRKDLARLRNEKQGEMLKDEPSEKVLAGIIESMGDLRTELQTIRMKARLEVREQLTEEQRDKMMTKGERHGRRGGRQGRQGRRCLQG